MNNLRDRVTSYADQHCRNEIERQAFFDTFKIIANNKADPMADTAAKIVAAIESND